MQTALEAGKRKTEDRVSHRAFGRSTALPTPSSQTSETGARLPPPELRQDKSAQFGAPMVFAIAAPGKYASSLGTREMEPKHQSHTPSHLGCQHRNVPREPVTGSLVCWETKVATAQLCTCDKVTQVCILKWLILCYVNCISILKNGVELPWS